MPVAKMLDGSPGPAAVGGTAVLCVRTRYRYYSSTSLVHPTIHTMRMIPKYHFGRKCKDRFILIFIRQRSLYFGLKWNTIPTPNGVVGF